MSLWSVGMSIVFLQKVFLNNDYNRAVRMRCNNVLQYNFISSIRKLEQTTSEISQCFHLFS